MERRGIAPRPLQCECSVLLLNYRPKAPVWALPQPPWSNGERGQTRNASTSLSVVLAGREGIEPSLRVLEARPVTMTLRPMLDPDLAIELAIRAPYGNRTRLTP